jgi:hypothetical protein
LSYSSRERAKCLKLHAECSGTDVQYKVVVNRHVEMNGALEKLLPASQHEIQTIDDRSHFLSMRRKYLEHGSFTLMSEMLNMLAYGKNIGLTAGNSSNTYSSEDKKTFYLNYRPILVSRFCKMVQELVAETSGSSDRTRLHARGQSIRDQCLAVAYLMGTILERFCVR